VENLRVQYTDVPVAVMKAAQIQAVEEIIIKREVEEKLQHAKIAKRQNIKRYKVH